MAYINGKKILTIIKGGGGSTGGNIAIDTLENTTWLLNNNVDASKSYDFNINFTANGIDYTSIDIDSADEFIYYCKANNEDNNVYDSVNKWLNPNNQTVKVTGGADAENIEAINWFLANGKLVSSGGEPVNGTIEITENGTHDVSKYASANVNVASSGGSGKQFTAEFVSSKAGIKATIPTAIMNKKQFTASMALVIE